MTSSVYSISLGSKKFNVVLNIDERSYLDQKFWQFEQNPTMFLSDYIEGALQLIKKYSIPVYDKILSNVLIRIIIENDLVDEETGKIVIDKIAIQKLVVDLADLIESKEKMKKTDFEKIASEIIFSIEPSDDELLLVHSDIKKEFLNRKLDDSFKNRLKIVLGIIEEKINSLE